MSLFTERCHEFFRPQWRKYLAVGGLVATAVIIICLCIALALHFALACHSPASNTTRDEGLPFEGAVIVPAAVPGPGEGGTEGLGTSPQPPTVEGLPPCKPTPSRVDVKEELRRTDPTGTDSLVDKILKTNSKTLVLDRCEVNHNCREGCLCLPTDMVNVSRSIKYYGEHGKILQEEREFVQHRACACLWPHQWEAGQPLA